MRSCAIIYLLHLELETAVFFLVAQSLAMALGQAMDRKEREITGGLRTLSGGITGMSRRYARSAETTEGVLSRRPEPS